MTTQSEAATVGGGGGDGTAGSTSQLHYTPRPAGCQARGQYSYRSTLFESETQATPSPNPAGRLVCDECESPLQRTEGPWGHCPQCRREMHGHVAAKPVAPRPGGNGHGRPAPVLAGPTEPDWLRDAPPPPGLELATQPNLPLKDHVVVGRLVQDPGAVETSANLPPTSPTTIGGPVVGRLVEVPASEIREAGLTGGDPLEHLPFLGLDGYVVKGWAHLVAGYPKAGKTELLTRLCQEWKGERVLYFTEEPRSIWAARLAGLPGDWSHVTLVFALGAEPEAILERIRHGSETVVVIDTVRNLLNIRDETDNSEVARVLNPFIAACREKNKTLLLAHHVRKGGGEHGEGITGGHAFLGVVDIALEVLRDGGNDLQRKVRGWGRVIAIPELLYQQEQDGTFRPLGSPSQVVLEGVKERLLEVLNGEWQNRKEILAVLDEPKPSFEQVRLALEALVDRGEVERDPAQPKSGVTYKYRLLGADQPTYHGTSLSGRLGLGGS